MCLFKVFSFSFLCFSFYFHGRSRAHESPSSVSTPTQFYLAPVDGNPNCKTVERISVPKPIPAGKNSKNLSFPKKVGSNFKGSNTPYPLYEADRQTRVQNGTDSPSTVKNLCWIDNGDSAFKSFNSLTKREIRNQSPSNGVPLNTEEEVVDETDSEVTCHDQVNLSKGRSGGQAPKRFTSLASNATQTPPPETLLTDKDEAQAGNLLKQKTKKPETSQTPSEINEQSGTKAKALPLKSGATLQTPLQSAAKINEQPSNNKKTKKTTPKTKKKEKLKLTIDTSTDTSSQTSSESPRSPASKDKDQQDYEAYQNIRPTLILLQYILLITAFIVFVAVILYSIYYIRLIKEIYDKKEFVVE